MRYRGSNLVEHLIRGGTWKTRPGSNAPGLAVSKALRERGYELRFAGTVVTRGGKRDVWFAWPS